MALADRVLVYGDCAVIPDPTAPQLADIAVSSAATADQFGISPRVAMLSYSTGESGSGADVEKVREATALVRELENRVKRAVIMADGKSVTAADLDLAVAPDDGINLRAAREAADRRAIRHALARADGNISQTARLLGVSRPTLYDLLKSYDLHD